MILVEKSKTLYRCVTAFLTDLDDKRQATVRSKGDVLDFLKKHPDQQFVLVADGEPAEESQAGDARTALFCGLVKWDSKTNAIQNRSLAQ